MKTMKMIALTCLWILIALPGFAQIDTEFWFVVPEAMQEHGDRPIFLRLSTLQQPATVTVSLPANPTVTPIVVTILPNSSQSVDLTPWIDLLENIPADSVLNHGLFIQSTTEITAYYEIATGCNCNPEIFTLKGKNALGYVFYTPFQTAFNRSPGYYSAVDIVATENNTLVTITPTKDATGRPANVPFTILLNKGQTYSLRASGFMGTDNLAGSKIVSSKPIAVTVKEDSVGGPGGCGDILGDQIVPENLVGKKYIVIKGFLNYGEAVYFLATENNTAVYVNGSTTPVTTLNTGQSYSYLLSGNTFVESNKPMYVYHISGYGCELGSALLPSIECTGSSQIGFVRSTNELFSVYLIIRNGSQDKFKLNGNPNVITPGQFQVLPGTSNQWVCAQISFNTSQIPVDQGQIISNSGDVFHLGLINGGSVSGCRYGYFSDFSSLYLGADRLLCSGDTTTLDAGSGKGSYLWSTGDTTRTIKVAAAGQYWVQAGTGFCVMSDTILISLRSNPSVSLGNDTTLCGGTGYTLTVQPGFTSYLWNNLPGTNVNVVNTSGLVWLKVTDTAGCSARDTVMVTFIPSVPVSVTLTASANPVCQGDTVHYTAHITNAGSNAALQWYVNGLPVYGSSIINGLVAHYPFNGTLADATGNSQNAVPNGNVSWTTDRFGNSNSAYYIGGNSSGMDYLTVANSSALAIQNPFSVSVWVNKEAHGGWIVNKGRDVVNGYGIADASCNAFVVYGQNNGAGILNTTVSLNQWHLYTCVFLSDSASFYVDGLLADKQHMPSSSYVSTSSNYPLAIGRHFTACCYNPDPWYYSYPYKGKVDDIRIYNRSLTAAEVWQLYQGFDSTFSYVPQNGDIVTCIVTATGNCLSNNPDTSNAITMIVHPLPANLGQATSSLSQGLIASYPFNGNANDVSGNGNNGIVYGATLAADRFGNANSAYYFNNASIHAPISYSPSFTTSVWFKYHSVLSNTYPTFFALGQEIAYSQGDVWYGSGKLYSSISFADNTGLSKLSSVNVLDNNWHHAVISYDSITNHVRFYIDNVQFLDSIKDGQIKNFDYLDIGRSNSPCCGYWSGTFFNGTADDLSVYNRALSSEEIGSLYTGNYPDLAASLSSDSICVGNNTALNILNSQAGIKYQMLLNGANYGNYLTGNGNTIVFPINGLMQTTAFTILATNTTTGCFTMLDSTFTVNVSNLNAVVSPASTICSGTNTTISASGGTGYIWSNGMTTASITVSPAATTVYYVTVTNGTWCMDSDSVKVNVNPSPVPVITGQNVICLGATNITYTTQPGMTGYVWTVTGGSITAGTGTNSVTVTWNSLGAQTVSVIYTNTLGCTAILPAVLNVTVNPMPAPVIAGNSSMCVASGYYDYTTEPGMTNYTWSISPGGTILYGNGTNGLIVTWDIPGPQWVKVNYTNSSGCTASIPTQLNVTVNPLPGAAGTVTGSGSVCAGATGINYSTTLIPDAVTYVWSLPFGASISSGSGTNSILVDFGPTTQSGDITVYGNNLCGNGTVSVPFHVNVSALPGLAGTPTGDEVVCQGDTGIIYYVSPIQNAVNYVWDITGGGVITTGNGTNSIRAEFPAGPANCAVTVYGSNSCGAGLISPAKYVTVNLLPPVPVITQNGPELVSSAPAGNQWYFNGTLIPGADQPTYTPALSGTYTVIVTLLGCSSSASDGLYFIMTAIAKPQPFTVKVYPVPNDGKFRVYLNSGETEQVNLSVMNALGQKIWELSGIELNGDKQQIVDLRPVPPGVYTLVIEGESLRVVRKVVVE